MADQWFYAVNNEKKGPVDFDTLKTLAANNIVSPSTLVWKQGMASWTAASEVAELSSHTPAASSPPPLPSTARRRITLAREEQPLCA